MMNPDQYAKMHSKHPAQQKFLSSMQRRRVEQAALVDLVHQRVVHKLLEYEGVEAVGVETRFGRRCIVCYFDNEKICRVPKGLPNVPIIIEPLGSKRK